MDDSASSLLSPAQPRRASPTTQQVLIAVAVVYIAVALLWIGPALMLGMVFDAPFVSLLDRFGRNLVFWASFTWPVTLVVAAVMLCKHVRSGVPGTWRSVGGTLALPLVNVALVGIGLVMPR